MNTLDFLLEAQWDCILSEVRCPWPVSGLFSQLGVCEWVVHDLRYAFHAIWKID